MMILGYIHVFLILLRKYKLGDLVSTTDLLFPADVTVINIRTLSTSEPTLPHLLHLVVTEQPETLCLGGPRARPPHGVNFCEGLWVTGFLPCLLCLCFPPREVKPAQGG